MLIKAQINEIGEKSELPQREACGKRQYVIHLCWLIVAPFLCNPKFLSHGNLLDVHSAFEGASNRLQLRNRPSLSEIWLTVGN